MDCLLIYAGVRFAVISSYCSLNSLDVILLKPIGPFPVDTVDGLASLPSLRTFFGLLSSGIEPKFPTETFTLALLLILASFANLTITAFQ